MCKTALVHILEKRPVSACLLLHTSVCSCVYRNVHIHTFSPTTFLFPVNVAGSLQWNCPDAPWSEGLSVIKPWAIQATMSETLQHKDINTQHKKTLQSPTRETRPKKEEQTPSPTIKKKKAWLIRQATWKLCLLLLLLDLLKAWIWVKHPPFSLSLSFSTLCLLS